MPAGICPDRPDVPRRIAALFSTVFDKTASNSLRVTERTVFRR